jgi:hypothetical protein
MDPTLDERRRRHPGPVGVDILFGDAHIKSGGLDCRPPVRSRFAGAT